MSEVKVENGFGFYRKGWLWTPAVDFYWGKAAQPYKLIITPRVWKEIKIGRKA